MVDTMENNLNGGIMKSTARNLVTACALGALGVALAAGGIYVGETDDAPGAALLGLLLMLGLVALGVKIARRKT
jgi:MYXO-CTERM domain-containing protein